MDESEVKAEMRLWALEVLVANAFAMLCALDPSPDDLFAKIRRQMIESSKKQTFRGFDAGESDVLSSEFEAAISRLLEMVATQMRLGLGKGER
jgi:hypothetical protein